MKNRIYGHSQPLGFTIAFARENGYVVTNYYGISNVLGRVLEVFF